MSDHPYLFIHWSTLVDTCLLFSRIHFSPAIELKSDLGYPPCFYGFNLTLLTNVYNKIPSPVKLWRCLLAGGSGNHLCGCFRLFAPKPTNGTSSFYEYRLTCGGLRGGDDTETLPAVIKFELYTLTGGGGALIHPWHLLVPEPPGKTFTM